MEIIINMEEKLQKIFANVNEWLKFAEAKNFGLLTLNAAIVFGISQTTFDDDSAASIVCYYLIIPIACLSSFFSLISLFPILTKIEKGTKLKGMLNSLSTWIDKEDVFENIHFYGYLRTIDETTFIDKINLNTGSTHAFNIFEKELITQILYNSRITWLKYQFFKIAGFLSLIGIVLSPVLYVAILLVKILF